VFTSTSHAKDSTDELVQHADLVGHIAKAMALIAPKMTQQDRQRWISRSPIELAETLATKVFLLTLDEKVVPTWKTVLLGKYKTSAMYRQALKGAGVCMATWDNNNARDVLDVTSMARTETEVDLVVRSVGDLGFKHSGCYADICAKAIRLGFALCPAEVGPALRLQYSDQPNGERLRVAMKAITDHHGRRCIYHVDRNGELWLDCLKGRPDHIWFADQRFIFMRPKQAR